MRRGEQPIGAAYRGLIEELMWVADAGYRAAEEAIPALPPSFGRAVAVAARVYAGIHDAIRSRGYDTVRSRAYTSGARKVWLGACALWTLRASRERHRVLGRPVSYA
jgi:phytoene synthase